MNKLAMFVPLAKADAAQRLVYGYFDETPDRVREVCDYPTAKAAFQAWSAELEKASNGKSLGNIRGQHGNIAAGKLVEITYDDQLKKIGFVAKIVDDNEWQKVDEGVYTGFSPGGRYGRTWKKDGYTRYTPIVRELSIVDVPCNPAATFTMVKADGSEQEVEFVLSKVYEPGNEATKARADDLAKAAGPDAKAKDFVIQARADLIAEQATAELAKMAAAADDEDEAEDDTTGEDKPKDGEEVAKSDPVDSVNAALAKAKSALEGAGTPVVIVDGPFADLSKAAEALALISVPADHAAHAVLRKSLWSTEWLNSLLREFACLQSEVTWDEKIAHSDDMAIPQKAAEIVKSIGELLIQMTQEGVADLLTNIANSGIEIDTIVIEGDTVVMALAEQIVDLVKADEAIMEKAAARIVAPDMSEDDTADALAKAVEVQDERDRLAKAFAEVVPQIEELTKSIETMAADRAADRDTITKLTAQVETLGAQPVLGKGLRLAPDKGADLTEEPLEKGVDDDKLSFNDRLAKEKNPVKRAQMILGPK